MEKNTTLLNVRPCNRCKTMQLIAIQYDTMPCSSAKVRNNEMKICDNSMLQKAKNCMGHFCFYHFRETVMLYLIRISSEEEILKYREVHLLYFKARFVKCRALS